MKLRLFAATVAATAAVGAVAGILWSRRAGDESASAKGEVSQHELIAKGDIGVGDPIPLSRTEPILSIRGLISNTNDGARTRMDMDALESLPLVRLRVYEPFEDKERPSKACSYRTSSRSSGQMRAPTNCISKLWMTTRWICRWRRSLAAASCWPRRPTGNPCRSPTEVPPESSFRQTAPWVATSICGSGTSRALSFADRHE